MGEIYYVVIPVVVVVVVLKLCLIFWRIWLYQRRRERLIVIQNQRRAQPTARVIGVERSCGPEGFTQRTSYLVNQPGMPARQITRTIVIRPNDNRRPNDPNLPPSYDNAVTGRDKSVKVEEGAGQVPPPTSAAGATLPTVIESSEPPSAPPPAFQEVPPPHMASQPPPPPPGDQAPPAYTPQAPYAPPPSTANSNSSYDSDETTRLLA